MLKQILLATAFASTLGTTAAFAAPPSRPVIPSAPAYGPRARADLASLGEVRVGGRRASTLEVGRFAGPMEKLHFVVRDGDMGLKTVRITFGNGATMVTRVSGRFATVDLPGGARNVRSISIDPAGFTHRGRAVVEVLGDRAGYARR